MSNSEPLMTAAAVAGLLNVHLETVRRWTRSGKLASVKLPNKTVRYRREDVDALISGDAVPA